MERFEKSLRIRLVWMRLYGLVLVLVLLWNRFVFALGNSSNPFQLALGMSVGLMLVMFYFGIQYGKALESQESLRKLYIKEHDERNALIMAKTGGMAINLVMAGLALGAVVSCFIDDAVCFSLLGACVFTALVKGALKVYYRFHL